MGNGLVCTAFLMCGGTAVGVDSALVDGDDEHDGSADEKATDGALSASCWPPDAKGANCAGVVEDEDVDMPSTDGSTIGGITFKCWLAEATSATVGDMFGCRVTAVCVRGRRLGDRNLADGGLEATAVAANC